MLRRAPTNQKHQPSISAVVMTCQYRMGGEGQDNTDSGFAARQRPLFFSWCAVLARGSARVGSSRPRNQLHLVPFAYSLSPRTIHLFPTALLAGQKGAVLAWETEIHRLATTPTSFPFSFPHFRHICCCILVAREKHSGRLRKQFFSCTRLIRISHLALSRHFYRFSKPTSPSLNNHHAAFRIYHICLVRCIASQ